MRVSQVHLLDGEKSCGEMEAGSASPALLAPGNPGWNVEPGLVPTGRCDCLSSRLPPPRQLGPALARSEGAAPSRASPSPTPSLSLTPVPLPHLTRFSTTEYTLPAPFHERV